MFYSSPIVRILALSFIITQAWCMESDEPLITVVTKGTTQLVSFGDLLQQYGKEAVAQTINKNSPNIFSSTYTFISNHPKGVLQAVGYGTLIALILALPGSKYYWVTPKKFDNLLKKHEDKIAKDLSELKILLDEAHTNVKTVYQTNLTGVNAGLAVLNNTIEQSHNEVANVYSLALAAELNRRRKLEKKAAIASRVINAGLDGIDLSFSALKDSAEQNENDTYIALEEQKDNISNLTDSFEKEFLAASDTMDSNHNQKIATLNALAIEITDDHYALSELIHQTNQMAIMLQYNLEGIDGNNERTKREILEARRLLAKQNQLIAQLTKLVQEPTLLPGSLE